MCHDVMLFFVSSPTLRLHYQSLISGHRKSALKSKRHQKFATKCERRKKVNTSRESIDFGSIVLVRQLFTNTDIHGMTRQFSKNIFQIVNIRKNCLAIKRKEKKLRRITQEIIKQQQIHAG